MEYTLLEWLKILKKINAMGPRNNFITIQGWMISDLGLSGNDLLIYAVIYGYSQDGESEYYGSLTHLSELLGLGRRTVLRTLQKLCDARLLSKRAGVLQGKARCFYSATAIDDVKNLDHGALPFADDSETAETTADTGAKMAPVSKRYWCQNSTGTGVKMAPVYNNINNNKIKENSILSYREKEKEETDAEASYSPPLNNQKRIFIKPSIEEIRRYCADRQNDVDAERFHAFYESNGWRVGKNGMKDWRAAVRTWELREKTEKQNKNNQNETRTNRITEARERIISGIEETERAYHARAATRAHAEDFFGAI